MPHPNALHVQGLSKHYNTPRGLLQVVDDVSFDVRRGEFVVVMGPSGSGKSTLLALLGGLIRPSGGAVQLEGMNLHALSDEDITRVRRFRLGFVFQAYHLLEHMTALENVLFPLQFSERTASEQQARARELLAMVGLAERMDHFPRQLSGGEKQRVAIARALANEPALLLADEPTGNLDAKATTTVLEILQDLNHRLDQTIVMVTHDPEARAYATRVLRLDEGRLTPDVGGEA